jgi:hypothetical protein
MEDQELNISAVSRVNLVERRITGAFSVISSVIVETPFRQLAQRRAQMRKLLLSLAAAGSALAIASPAAAQWRAPAHHYQPYNFHGAFNHHAFARSMEIRVQRIRSDIRGLQAQRIVSRREAGGLEREAANLQNRIYWASRNNIQPGEAQSLERQIRTLEYRVEREATDRNNRPGGYRRY